MADLPLLPPRAYKTRQSKFKNSFGLQPVLGGLGTTKQGPRYRGPETQARKDAKDLMRQLSMACKYLTERERASVEKIAEHSQLYWRDVVFQLLTGRFWYFVEEGVGKHFSMASQAEVSLLLDAISQLRGAILFRGSDQWKGLDAGATDYVLTAQGPGADPVWAPSGTGGGASVSTVVATSDGTASTSWPKKVTWNAAPVDENSFWSAGTPDRLFIPAGASAIRLSCAVLLTVSTSLRPFIAFTDQADTIRYDLGCYGNFPRDSTGYSTNAYNMMGPWIPPPAGIDYLRLNISVGTATSGSWLQSTFATLEAR